MKNNQEIIGKRYSEALFDVAVEQDELEQVYQDLQALQSVYQNVDGIGFLLTTDNLQKEQKETLFEELLKPFSQLVQNTLKVMYKNRRMNDVPIVIESFNQLYDLKNNVVKGKVFSVVELQEEQRAKLEQEVARLLDYNKVTLINEIDSSLIGGFVINVNNQVIDRSLKQKLQQIEQSLLEI